MHEEFEQLLEAHWEGRLDEDGERRLEALAASDPALGRRLAEERRVDGLLRAVGASRLDLILIVLAQAVLLGLMGGLCGIAGAVGVAALLDWCVRTFLAEFPFMPTSFFVLPLWLELCGLAAAVLAAATGALAPALRAARVSVARGLS